MSDAPRYRITSLADFLAVPPDRLLACLIEFGVVVETWRATEAAGLNPRHEFTWIDDGDGEMTLRFQTPAGDHVVDVPLGNWLGGDQ